MKKSWHLYREKQIRLDYLLINMQGLHKKLEGTVQGGRLAEAILTMQRKRNKFVGNECVM